MDIDRVISSQQISRRNLLKRGGILAGAAIGMPAILAACAPDAPTPPAGSSEPTAIDTSNIAGSKIKVGTYGGFFEENFAKMYPAFTEEFDVEVESVSRADVGGMGRPASADDRGRRRASRRRLDALGRRPPAGDQRGHPREVRDLATSRRRRTSRRATSGPTTTATSRGSAVSPGTSRSSPTPTG